MQKIISLFQRNYTGDRLVRDEVVPGAEWVLAGEGVATAKWDGTACLVQGGVLYKRYDAKHGKTPPAGFVPAQDPDPVTGHWPGWLAVNADDPANRWHVEAWVAWHREHAGTPPPNGTYELLGPKVQSNPYDLGAHLFVRHGDPALPGAPRTFLELRDYFTAALRIEGIVWHHPDGRLVKIKRKDFGLRWPPPKEED